MGDLIQDIRNATAERKIQWGQHVLERMVARRVSREDVIYVLSNGELIEDYPNDRPFPSCLLMAAPDQQPLHVVAAFDPHTTTVFVVTVYEPDLDHFEEDRQTRRRD